MPAADGSATADPMTATPLPPGASMAPAAIAVRSGSSFLVGFRFLGKPRRDGMTSIYAFCRVVDDAVDDAPDRATAEAHLSFWRRELAAVFGDPGPEPPTTEVGRALQGTVQAFGVERRHLEDLVDGMAMDLEPPYCRTEADLERYCYHAASAVGLACLPVMGATGVHAERFGERLGQALQWTNILRDLQGDAEQGRIYVPRDWLAELGIGEEMLLGKGLASAFATGGPMDVLVARVVEHAEDCFREARIALSPKLRKAVLPARIMAAVYHELLLKLQACGGRLTTLPRQRVPKWRKLQLAASCWLRPNSVKGV